MDYTDYIIQRDLRRISYIIAKIKADKAILEQNKEDIILIDQRAYNSGITLGTRIIFLTWWGKLAVLLGQTPFRNATRRQIDDILYGLKTGELATGGRPLSSKTLNNFIASTIKLYKMLYDVNQREELPECVRFLRNVKSSINGGHSLERLNQADLFTQQEITRIVEMEPNIRNKALIKILFECAPRISELLSVNIGDVEFKNDEKEAVLKIRRSKTKIRPILVIDSFIELKNWFAQHPRNWDAGSPLWFSIMDGPMGPGTAIRLLKIASKRAGFNKRIYPHLLRHSGWTYKKLRGMSDDEGRQLLGWTKTSSMPTYYAHLTIENAFDKQRQLSGLEPKSRKQEEEPMKKYEECRKCNLKFPVGTRVCSSCNYPLNETERLKKISEKQEELNKQMWIITQYQQLEPLLNKMKEMEPFIHKFLDKHQ